MDLPFSAPLTGNAGLLEEKARLLGYDRDAPLDGKPWRRVKGGQLTGSKKQDDTALDADKTFDGGYDALVHWFHAKANETLQAMNVN